MSCDDGSFSFDNLYVVSVFLGKIKDTPIIDLISIFICYSYYVIGGISGSTTINLYYYGKVVKSIYDDTSKIYTCFKPVTAAYPIEILYI